jgi:hypothetical protein
LQVIYVPDEDSDSVFVVTAYELQGEEGVSTQAAEEVSMKKQKFPRGWNEKRVSKVLTHYEGQSENEQFAEIEAARASDGTTLMAIPTELVPAVRALIARKQSN